MHEVIHKGEDFEVWKMEEKDKFVLYVVNLDSDTGVSSVGIFKSKESALKYYNLEFQTA